MKVNYDILDIMNRFESKLSRYFETSTKAQQLINEAMMYSLKAGGKRIRPRLLIETALSYGCELDKIMDFAVAIEMIHTYSLIHDDLPCMDDDDLRRGKPTNHIVFGYDIAVLAGDGLLNLASEIMTASIIENDYLSNYTNAMFEILKASGSSGMILGQVADIKYQDDKMSIDILDFINLNKTGKLLTAALKAGALLGNAPQPELEIIQNIGQDMGLLFQVVDDLLDVTGNAEKLGKRTQIDEKNDKVTYPRLMGINQTKITIKAYENKIVEHLKDLTIDTQFLKEIVAFLVTRDH